MKAISSSKIIRVVAATLLLGTVSVLAQTAGTKRTLTGIVSDAMCGQTHMIKDKTPAECVRICIKDGSKYALVVGNTVYTLTGHEEAIDKLAGQKASVTGMVKGDTMMVTSVAPSK